MGFVFNPLSRVTTGVKSINPPWCRAPRGAHDQF